MIEINFCHKFRAESLKMARKKLPTLSKFDDRGKKQKPIEEKMSLNLLAAYGSDEDASGDEEDFFSKPAVKEEEDKEEKEADTEQKAECSKEAEPSKSFFFSGEDRNEPCSSDSEEEGQGNQPNKTTRKRKSQSAVNLPTDFKSSIFDNDYSREERLNVQMLSQHVELCDKPSVNHRRSKQTCRAYLKGKCRFGDKCRFSHPKHDRNDVDVNAVSTTAKPQMYDDSNSEVTKIFQSKRFKAS
ncbi:unnamed protein product [Caenorhabditis auriculariae]|uniref:C3H1-type domain-containing protein n=1 Tax=Caenorhabditis auriculariae TaxID=2777116 RepID=A0A8S1I0K1_9PELO|nr:unnamed protein product [Caenorhabditis auriculariae]